MNNPIEINMNKELKSIQEQYDKLSAEACFRKAVSLLFEVRPVGIVNYELFLCACNDNELERITNTTTEQELIEVVKDIWNKRNLEWIRKTWK